MIVDSPQHLALASLRRPIKANCMNLANLAPKPRLRRSTGKIFKKI